MSIATTVFAEQHLQVSTVELRCDKCGDIDATDVDNESWHAAMCTFRTMGWAATGLNTHLCPVCAAKLREEQADAEYTPTYGGAIDVETLPHGLRRYAALVLHRFMSDTSQVAMCAGWYSGNERILWQTLRGESNEYELETEDIERLQILARDAGGWWFYDNDDHKLRFVGMDEAEERMASA